MSIKRFFSKLRRPMFFFRLNPMEYIEYPFISKMFGIELELFLVDRNGKITNSADVLLKKLKARLIETQLKAECGHSMIELTSFPHISSKEVFGKFFTDFETLLYEAEKENLGLFYYGCYPGKNETDMRKDARYAAKEKILGEEEFSIAGKCIGFHYHYSLPTMSFNKNVNFFYLDIGPVKKKKIVSLFNLYVALDPIATTFMQSSPYFEGNLIGKDARAIAYRGDPIFNFPHSLYSKYPEFGTLNDYEDDFEKMTKKIMERTNKWKKLLKDNNLTYSEFMKDETSILDSSWKPVKISPHATIENRSSDMNSLDKIFAMSNAMKYISRHVENNTITVVPSKTGDSEPFKLEDKTLYVPQMETLLELQKNSLIFGFEDRNVLHYCNSFLNLVSSIPDIKKQYLQVFYRMINDEKTTSDEIIDFVKKKQGKDDFKTVKDSTAQELALELKEKLYKDLLLTKKLADMTEHATVDTIT